tara:strand:- start:60 stop:743 length:684 start_codon:yes stop_codon:yes gene_type:complete
VNITAIILARGGSKGIPNKNIIDFCGKPLIAWTIEHCFKGGIEDVYVSSDSKEIIEISKEYNSKTILRPKELSKDESSSESAWLHAYDTIKNNKKIDWIFAPQVTSPLRQISDVKNALKLASSDRYDSIFSCSTVEDLFFWKESKSSFKSINYDWRNRKRRQDIDKQYIENGSFYLFKPIILEMNKNRFGEKIGIVEMDFWKMFEIDSMDDLRMCSALMKEFLLEKI